MRDMIVQLIRGFFPASLEFSDWEFLSSAGRSAQSWRQLEELSRVLILADPGAGKTFEAMDRARKLKDRGHKAFFIRIEAINADFEQAFEVGTSDEFTAWLESTEEAWFFLDSVDEAQLETQRALEEAIRIFGTRIHDARERAHVYITSREDAWQALSDRTLIEQHLPFGAPAAEESDGGEDGRDHGDNETDRPKLQVFRLAPLNTDEIKLFAAHFGIGDAEAFVAEIERSNLMAMAGRPFDLKALISKWQADRALGSRLAMLRKLIGIQLAPLSSVAANPKLSPDRALAGARAVAVASTLTGHNVISMPDGLMNADRLDPVRILPEWSSEEISALLRTGIFDDIVYGSVRFRHREFHELLTAEWAHELLQNKDKRPEVEALFFRTQYGEEVIVPRLRPTLTWLILFDPASRDRALALEPSIAAEGGDPSQLPLEVRRKMLADMVGRIAADDNVAPIIDNVAISRIASADLEPEVLALISELGSNDDVIFFLGRFVWQGQMKECLADLARIAADPKRGIYARIASARAVMSLEDASRQQALWESILSAGRPIERRLLAELLEGAVPTERSIELLLKSIDLLEPYERFQVTGFDRALHGFIERIPMIDEAAPDPPLALLAKGLNAFLDRPPFVERRDCRVSEPFSWLMGPALHAVERLVSGRAVAALDPDPIAILLKLPVLRFWRTEDLSEYKTKLGEHVPRRRELNDALYWASVEERRAHLEQRGERMTDDRQLSFFGHFWNLGPEDFDRCLVWVADKPELDDQLVALSRCITLYLDRGRPQDWLDRLNSACAARPELSDALQLRLNPPPSPERDRLDAEHQKWERTHRRRERKEQRDRAEWVRSVRANPDRVRNSGLEPGAFSNDQFWLLLSLQEEGVRHGRDHGCKWRDLIPEFGEEVANAFCDAAKAHWRVYSPGLRSEGADRSSTPYSLIFGMAGLEIEAGEDNNFPNGLTEAEARHAFRYITWELNGFPAWFEALYRDHPAAGLEAVEKELRWELEHSSTEGLYSFLHDILYHAPWLHREVAPLIRDWLMANDLHHAERLRYGISILEGGGLSSSELAALARTKLDAGGGEDQRARWYALWVDNAPDEAIPALGAELAGLEPTKASQFAQQFIVDMLGERHGTGSRRAAFRTAEHLKSLYILMHRFIRSSDDIERAGKGVYSPTLRDNAQDARNRLFAMLSEVPGIATYNAIKALEEEHPELSYRRWMAYRARERAIADADEPLWTADQVRDFGE